LFLLPLTSCVTKASCFPPLGVSVSSRRNAGNPCATSETQHYLGMEPGTELLMRAVSSDSPSSDQRGNSNYLLCVCSHSTWH
jgi:hypothetical protein